MTPIDNPSFAQPPLTPESGEPPTAQQRLATRIRTYFLTGLVVAGPVVLTLYLTWTFVTWVDDLVRPLIPIVYRPETYMPVKIPGLGLILAFVILTTLGFLTANFVGRKLVELGEMLLERMPIVRPLYRGLKQVFETVFSKNGSTFRTVGLVQFPAPGMWSLVFLSTPPSADILAHLPPDEHVSVFLPCTPNPTTGFFFYLPRREIIELPEVPVEDAAKLIMTAGMVQPGGSPAQNRDLAALAQKARAAQAVRESVTAK